MKYSKPALLVDQDSPDAPIAQAAQQELTGSQELLRLLFEYAPDAIFISTAKEGRFVDINESAIKIFGYTREELIGYTAEKLNMWANYSDRTAMIQNLREGRPVNNLEGKFRRKSGEIFYGTMSVEYVDIAGVQCLLSILRDVTQRKRTEEEVSHLKRQIEFILGATKTGLDIIDSNFNMVYIDPEWQKTYGDPTGKKCYEYFMGRSEICPGCGITKALETKQTVVTEEVLVKENNRPIQVTTIPYQNDKGEWLVAEVNVDITERKKAEMALEESNKNLESTVWELKRSNRELRDFAYAAAHDLKAPLRAMGTIADWLCTDYAGKLDRQGAEQLRLLKLRAQRMSRLIDGILQYAEIEQADTRTSAVDLNILVKDVIAHIAPPENVEIIVVANLPTVLYAEAHLAQVFGCLIANAVTYLDKPKGRITVGCTHDADFWKFSVADNGRGIDEKHFDRIFRIFQTLSPRDRFETTGIGLALARKIIEMYGGKIWVESKVRRGSTFFFTLPKQQLEVNK